MHIVGRKYSAVRWNAQPMFRKIGGRCGQTTSSKRRKRKLGIGGVHPPQNLKLYMFVCAARDVTWNKAWAAQAGGVSSDTPPSYPSVSLFPLC